MNVFGSGIGKLRDKTPRSVDVLESDDEVVLIAELPGFDEDEVNMWLAGDEIEIEARRDKDLEGGFDYVRDNRPEKLDYEVSLGRRLDADTARARIENGLLRVRIKKEDRDVRELELEETGEDEDND